MNICRNMPMYLLLCLITISIWGIQSTQLDGSFYREFLMPGVSPKTKDAYLCTSMKLNATEEWIVRYEPLASANRAHHMLLYGCSDVHNRNRKGYWDCGHHGICEGSRIIYAWAKNAPSTNLPDDVGFRIGKEYGVRYLVLQIHYANALPAEVKDHSGLKMLTTTTRQKYKAGIYLLAKGFLVIPGRTEKVHGDLNCDVNLSADINLFAYRVHAHVLGAVISGYRYDQDTSELNLIAKGNPQWPQSFYPTEEIFVIKPHDVIHARCTFNSTGRKRKTFIGATSDDEMCNLYLMYYTDRENGPDNGYCGVEQFPKLTQSLPADSDEPLPENDQLERQTVGESTNKDKEISYDKLFNSDSTNEAEIEVNNLHQTRLPVKPQPVKVESRKGPEPTPSFMKRVFQKMLKADVQTFVTPFFAVKDWGPEGYKLGQASAVAVDSHGDIVIFHRADRVWDGSSFNGPYLKDQSKPIASPTLLHLEKDNGAILHEWGANYFYMPHGLTLDAQDNVWLTDVGLHQVFKFRSGFADSVPQITLGERFVPGKGPNSFCKPTAVAVMANGEFFVSDGYCNSRIVHFSQDGTFVKEIDANKDSPIKHSFGSFSIPHALTLTRADEDVCAADRENGRVLCFHTNDFALSHEFRVKAWGRVFSTVYSKLDDKLYVVNGPQVFGGKINVFQLNFSSNTLEAEFSPDDHGFSNPHDLALSSDGSEIYVVEIGPNKIWKFSKELTPNTTNSSRRIIPRPVVASIHKAAINGLNLYGEGWSSTSIVYIVVAMVGIPILVLSTMALCAHYRSDSPTKHHPLGVSGKSGLKLLLNRNGFERLPTNDLLSDSDSTDSEVEDFVLDVAKV